MNGNEISPNELEQCIATLKRLHENGSLLESLAPPDRVRLMSAAGRLSRPAKMEQKKRNREIDRARRQRLAAADKSARAGTQIRSARRQAVFQAPPRIENAGEGPLLARPRSCYVCKEEFSRLHFFYDSMCPSCADFNYRKRFQTAPMQGQVAVITGARLKIGYQAALLILRAGARVYATTRFPVDAARRFAREADFGQWGDRLHVYGLDLRHTPSVEIFADHIDETAGRLDVLINNAAQTVRRPPGFYAHLMAGERLPADRIEPEARKLLSSHRECASRLHALAPTAEAQLPANWHRQTPGIGLMASAELSQIPYSYDQSLPAAQIFPAGRLDADLQQVDLRRLNSWRLALADVPTMEMLEVQLVNSVAPFVLCSRLAPLMRRDPTGKKHIVNVSAMEGKFSRHTKTDKHPHTNMAKAALNMLTLTSAPDLAKDGIYMNAVDTGWVTDEDPLEHSLRKQDMHDFEPPLDIVDGAARVCDPFFDGINTGRHWCGKFLKDYFPTDW